MLSLLHGSEGIRTPVARAKLFSKQPA